jgi:hypothetical protein
VAENARDDTPMQFKGSAMEPFDFAVAEKHRAGFDVSVWANFSLENERCIV